MKPAAGVDFLWGIFWVMFCGFGKNAYLCRPKTYLYTKVTYHVFRF